MLDRSWNARSRNAPAERLFTGWLDQPGDRNLLSFIFLAPAARTLICDWERRARRVAAEFRAATSGHRQDPALRRRIQELHAASPEFARFWDEHAVLGREGGERTFNHPRDGFVRYEQVTFNLAEHPDWRLTLLTRSHDESQPRQVNAGSARKLGRVRQDRSDCSGAKPVGRKRKR